MKGNFKVYFVIAIFALGVTFEVLKSINVDSFQESKPVGMSNKDLNGLNLEAFHRTDKDSTRTGIESRKQELGKHIKSGRHKFPQNHSFTEGKKGKDKKKNAKVAKKKKVKKKKKEGEEENEDEQKVLDVADTEPNENDKDDQDQEKPEDSPYPTAGAGAPFAPAKTNDNGIPITFEDWQALVIDDASFKNTTKLIKFFQTDIVEPGVFYDLVDAMIASDNPEVKKQGVRAAAVTPSVRSFLALSYAIQTEESGSETRTIAVSSINRSYQQLSNLDVLRSVLSTDSNRYAMLLAAQSLESSIKRNLKSSNNNGELNPSSQNNSPSKTDLSKFKPFYFILSNLANSSDADVSRKARDILDDLSQLIDLAEA